MPYIERSIVIIGILINLILIAGFIFGKNLLKDQTTTDFKSKFTISLVFAFATYFMILIALIILAFIHNLYISGLTLSLFLIIPFIIGYFSTFEKANLFINIQILALLLSFYIIVSMISTIQTQNLN